MYIPSTLETLPTELIEVVLQYIDIFDLWNTIRLLNHSFKQRIEDLFMRKVVPHIEIWRYNTFRYTDHRFFLTYESGDLSTDKVYFVPTLRTKRGMIRAQIKQAVLNCHSQSWQLKFPRYATGKNRLPLKIKDDDNTREVNADGRAILRLCLSLRGLLGAVLNFEKECQEQVSKRWKVPFVSRTEVQIFPRITLPALYGSVKRRFMGGFSELQDEE